MYGLVKTYKVDNPARAITILHETAVNNLSIFIAKCLLDTHSTNCPIKLSFSVCPYVCPSVHLSLISTFFSEIAQIFFCFCFLKFLDDGRSLEYLKIDSPFFQESLVLPNSGEKRVQNGAKMVLLHFMKKLFISFSWK